MTLYKRRQRFATVSVKVGIAFSKFGLSPNTWTVLSIVPIVIAMYFLMYENFLAAAFFFIVSAFLDLVDGSVARVTGKVTIKGAYLDTLVDRYIELFILLGLLFVSLPTVFVPAYIWIFIYLFGSLMTTYAKAAAKEKGLVEKELKGGLLERAERLIILFIGIVLAAITPLFLTYVLVILAVLTNVTALQRIGYALRAKAG
jgi:archaetidylinositol phosphate synthase